MYKFPTLEIKRSYLLLLITIFFCILGNYSYLEHVLFVYPANENLSFLIALSCVSILVTLVVATILSFFVSTKVALATLLLISASSGYFIDNFGVIIDDVMIQNIFETNADEAFDLLSIGIFIRLFLCAVLPILFIYFLKLPKITSKRNCIQKFKIIICSAIGIVLLLVIFSSHFTTFFREHKQLRYYLNPIYPIYSFGFYIKSQFKSEDTGEFKSYAFTKRPKDSKRNKLVIMVVGETVRASNFQLNGYARETTPLLRKRSDIINYDKFSSCGTSTAVSVPCMFSFEGKEDFDVNEAKRTENALDILSKAGVNVLWRDNNSSSKGVADRVQYQSFKTNENNTICDTECRDIGMLGGLDEYLNQHSGDSIIVLHQMGNHGPAYYKRYPKEFEIFKPACNTNELSKCSQQEIVNAYDNAIVYTDFLLEQTIRFLEKKSNEYETGMLYVSDHGESLGEKGLYLHGMPYFIAPKNQTHVPMLAWFSSTSTLNRGLAKKLSQSELNHDSLSYSLIDLFDISLDNNSSAYPLLFPKQKTQIARVLHKNASKSE